VEQILGNLLSNVEKYAGAGRWLRLATEASPRTVRLVVEDHGPGVPKAKKDAIFQPFVRLRNDLAEGASGTGIGLAISRELAQLHGGGLTLDDAWTEGARFVITLPNKQS
jgi:signal transduction histidine kinase